MKIANVSIDRPLTTMMIVAAMIFLGYISLVGLPIDLFPEIDFPMISIQTTYPGAAPAEVEEEITRKIEDAVSSLEDVEEITSSSYEGVSFVMIEFDWDIDLDLKAIDVREKVDLVQPSLPDDAEDPIVSKFDIMSNESVIRLSVTSKKTGFSRELETVPEFEREEYLKILKERQLQDTRKFVEDEVKEKLERVKGVATANVAGGLEREILVEVRPHDLDFYEISIPQITEALDEANVNSPGGRITEGDLEYTVRVIGKFKTVREIENISLIERGGKSIYLRDVADVTDTHKEVRTHSRTKSVESVGIEIVKKSGGNSVQIADGVKMEIAGINKRFPNYDVSVSLDYSQYIKDSIGMVKSNAIIGAVLSVIALLIFLRNVKSTFVVAVSIPTALVVTFFLIAQREMTLNLLSLGGLALGVGMLLDNSIVILENIYRHINMGEDPISGAKVGSQEVGVALTASTATTLAVFIPLIFFTSGIINQIFSDLAYTVVFSLAASLLVAVTFVPMASSRLLAATKESREREGINVLQPDGGGKGPSKESLKRTKDFFEGLLKPMLRHRLRTSLAVILIFAGSIALLMKFMSKEFFPKLDEGQFVVTMELGTGKSLEQTNKKTRVIENRVAEIPEDVLENYFATVNVSNTPNKSSATVKLVDVKKRNISVWAIMDRIREDLKKSIPGAKITVGEGEEHGGQGKPVQLLLKGDDFDLLKKTSERLVETISEIEGTADVDTSLRIGKPEITVDPFTERIGTFGLKKETISSTVRKYLAGDVATTFKEDDDQIDIRVKIKDVEALKTEDVEGLFIPLPTGHQIRLNEVASISEGRGPVVLERKDKQRMAIIASNLKEGYALGDITKEIEKKLETVGIPESQSHEFIGEEKDRQEAFRELGIALMIAIALVYMILVSQFESLVQPFVIMVTVPLSLIGVILACILTGTSLNIMVMLGMLMLTGIVVNNAIVLITYVNQLKAAGLSRHEALIKGMRTRLRPIIMTSMTTGFGMLPLALGIGSGSEFFSPLAIAVIGGLAISTIGSLLVIPVLDSIAEDFGAFILKRFSAVGVLLDKATVRLSPSKKQKKVKD